MPQDIVLHVNGESHTVRAAPETPLLYVLRNDLGLTSAKFGCGEGQCGACTVLVDGQPRPSCHVAVGSVQGREITTLEGLGTPEALHPLQQAFIDEGAVQCGYCTPGLIVAAYALLLRHPQPSDAQIRAALAAHLCRCGAYDRVRRAIHRAAGQQEETALAYAGRSGRETRELPAPDLAPARGPLPGPLQQNPSLDAWIRFDADGTVTVCSGKTELGQDLRTAVAMIAAEELDINLERMRTVMADTAQTPDEGYTGSSMSLETSGNAIRYAAAEARFILLAEASEALGAPVERLTVRDGTISDPATGQRTTYWELQGGKRFGLPVTGVGQPKGAASYHLLGQPRRRLDVAGKVTGHFRFVHDMRMPGMAYGRVVRGPGYEAKLVSADEAEARRLPGVLAVLRDGAFLGVVAEREEQAIAAMEALQRTATWENDTDLPPQERLLEHMLSQPQQAYLLVNGTPTEAPIPAVVAPPEAARTLAATYFRPYHSHASLGPSAAVALLDGEQLTVWSHTQGPYPVRAALAHALRMPAERIRCLFVEGPGSFGHNGADDVALDAALLARAVPGRPVRVQWTRAQENAWEPYGPATVIALQGSLNAAGEVIDWNHDVWGYTHSLRPRPRDKMNPLLASWHLAEPCDKPVAQPMLFAQTGMHRNADPLYTFPLLSRTREPRIVKHFLRDSPLRVSALRGLGSYASVFAVESFVDELALAAGADPVQFRLRYLADERARAVVEAAAEKAGWQAAPRPRGDGHGRGVAFAQYKNRQVYVAVVVDLRVDRATGRIALERAVVASDAGQIVNAEGFAAQVEGGFIQSSSCTLKEQVLWERRGVTSTDWRSYPILRLNEAPVIETVLLNRPGLPFVGVGEGVMGPAPAAIANAVYDAVGIRLRRIPFTPERVQAALG